MIVFALFYLSFPLRLDRSSLQETEFPARVPGERVAPVIQLAVNLAANRGVHVPDGPVNVPGPESDSSFVTASDWELKAVICLALPHDRS